MEGREIGLIVYAIMVVSVLLVLIVAHLKHLDFNQNLFYALRKRIFERKMKRNGFSTVQDVLNSLLYTGFKDWKINGEDIQYRLFKNTNVIFHRNSEQKELSIVSGKTVIFHTASTLDTQLFLHLTIIMRNVKEQEQKKTIQKSKSNETVQLVKQIKEVISKLEKEKGWLSIESCHRIEHTFMKDVEELLHTYDSLQNKERMESSVQHSLQIILGKLEQIKEEAENNKIFKIKQKQEVIENR